MIYQFIYIILIAITLTILILASYFDLKKGIIPNKINLFLIIFGISVNLLFSLIFNDIKFILASVISIVLTFFISYVAWKLKIWAGGDVKLFTAIAATTPTPINLSFLTGFFPLINFYPFSITIMLNSILVSFPFLIIFLIINIKNNSIIYLNKKNIAILLNIGILRTIIKENFNQNIDIGELEEGMVINNYYFNNLKISQAINENNGNLRSFKKDNNLYFFKSQTIAGISSKDLNLLKILHAQNFIKNNLSIKLGIPFAPSILFGFIIAIIFGDLIVIFSSLLKTIINVIL